MVTDTVAPLIPAVTEPLEPIVDVVTDTVVPLVPAITEPLEPSLTS